MNKKGAFEVSAEAPAWIWKLIPLTLIIMFFLAVAIVHFGTPFETEDIEQDIAYTSIFLCVTDSPGVINLEKITDEHLIACYNEKSTGFKVTVLDNEGKAVTTARTLTRQQELDMEVCSTKKESICSKRTAKTMYGEQEGTLVVEMIKNV